MSSNQKNTRTTYSEEDFDVVCEVCGYKWDFIQDRGVCPKCGDTLNRVEVADLKEEAFTRRRLLELTNKTIDKRSRKKPVNKKAITFVVCLVLLGAAGFVFFRFCPQYSQPVVDFLASFAQS